MRAFHAKAQPSSYISASKHSCLKGCTVAEGVSTALACGIPNSSRQRCPVTWLNQGPLSIPVDICRPPKVRCISHLVLSGTLSDFGLKRNSQSLEAMCCRINSTLLHLRNVTDLYTVVDTASEDNTVEVVRELMSGVPGQIIQHGPLKSFADARNHAFKVRQLLWITLWTSCTCCAG